MTNMLGSHLERKWCMKLITFVPCSHVSEFVLMKKFAIPMLVGAKNATCCIGF
jgi:hypothetical protein